MLKTKPISKSKPRGRQSSAIQDSDSEIYRLLVRFKYPETYRQFAELCQASNRSMNEYAVSLIVDAINKVNAAKEMDDNPYLAVTKERRTNDV